MWGRIRFVFYVLAVVKEVSTDGGATWNDAKITHQEVKPKDSKVFSWVLWKYHVKVNKDMTEISPRVRCVSDEGTVQDGRAEDMFNVRGLFNTTAH